MPDPSRLRDSTQIVLPRRALEGVRGELETRFTLTVQECDEWVRIIASPVVINDVSEFLTLHGVSVP